MTNLENNNDDYKIIKTEKKNVEFTTNSRSKKAFSTLIGCIIINLFLGCFYLWSNISVYVISYFFIFDHNMSYDSAFYVDTIFKFL